MKKEEFIQGLKSIKNIVCVSEFGSYRTKDWIKNRSDIDIAILVAPKISFIDTLNMEDEILELAHKFYNYNNIHLTFILYKDFSNKFARMAIESENLYIIDEIKWFDFCHYVRKYFRNNYEFERRMKINEQYELFGGIVDESIL